MNSLFSCINFRYWSKNWPWLTPTLPNVFVREISGRRQARFFLCFGSLIQSSQNPFGHLLASSFQTALLIIHPRPEKKSFRYSKSFPSTNPFLPLSFQADTHQSDLSRSNKGRVAMKYSKKSGARKKDHNRKIVTWSVNHDTCIFRVTISFKICVKQC